MEDYLETIYCTISKKGFVKTKDIARKLNVSPPTVTEMLHKLGERKLIIYEPYKPVKLTVAGSKAGKAIFRRHETLRKLLNLVFVSDEVAADDACKMEHILNPETVNQFSKLVEFVEKAPHYPKWLEHFRIFCETGKIECSK